MVAEQTLERGQHVGSGFDVPQSDDPVEDVVEPWRLSRAP